LLPVVELSVVFPFYRVSKKNMEDKQQRRHYVFRTDLNVGVYPFYIPGKSWI